MSKPERVLDAVSRDLLEAGDWCASCCSEGVSGLFLRSCEMTDEDGARDILQPVKEGVLKEVLKSCHSDFPYVYLLLFPFS